jgi:hypothetical protein
MKKLLKITLPTLLILGMLATGCAAIQSTSVMRPDSSQVGTPPAPAAAPESAFTALMSKGTADQTVISPTEGTGGANTERRIVMTGYISLEVKDSSQSMDNIATLAKDLGGYVVSSNKQVHNETLSGSISIRIPVECFDEALSSINKLAMEVSSERTEGKDVTEEYTDLKAQLRNLEATESQYLALLQKAQTVEDILKVQRELSNVRGQIEQIKGRIQYLERTSDMALIQISLQEPKAVGGNSWSATKTLESAVNGLITFAKILANVFIWLVIFLPIWGIILFLVIFFRRRRKSKAKTS